MFLVIYEQHIAFILKNLIKFNWQWIIVQRSYGFHFKIIKLIVFKTIHLVPKTECLLNFFDRWLGQTFRSACPPQNWSKTTFQHIIDKNILQSQVGLLYASQFSLLYLFTWCKQFFSLKEFVTNEFESITIYLGKHHGKMTLLSDSLEEAFTRKEIGGLGLWNSKTMNEAMATKLGLGLITKLEALWWKWSSL